MAWLSLGPLVEARSVHHNLAVGREFDVRAVHGARRGTLEIDAFAVVTAAVAGTLKLVLAGFPIRRAAEMSAARVDDKDAVGRAIYPYAIFLLPLGVDAEGVVRAIANLESGGRLSQRARTKTSPDGDEAVARK